MWTGRCLDLLHCYLPRTFLRHHLGRSVYFSSALICDPLLDLLPHLGGAYPVIAFWEKAAWEVPFLTPWILKNTFTSFSHLNGSLPGNRNQGCERIISFWISKVLFHCRSLCIWQLRNPVTFWFLILCMWAHPSLWTLLGFYSLTLIFWNFSV